MRVKFIENVVPPKIIFMMMNEPCYLVVKYHIVIDTIISKLFNFKTEKNRSTVTYPTATFYRYRS